MIDGTTLHREAGAWLLLTEMALTAEQDAVWQALDAGRDALRDNLTDEQYRAVTTLRGFLRVLEALVQGRRMEMLQRQKYLASRVRLLMAEAA